MMKILKTLALSFLVIVFFGKIYGGYDSGDEYSDILCFGDSAYLSSGDIRSRSIAIMNMIDETENKSKTKYLSLQLEVELNILIAKLSKKIEVFDEVIKSRKEELYSKNDATQGNIRRCLNEIERKEKEIQLLEGGLHLAKQWKRDYCR